jgi:hypothetical protein
MEYACPKTWESLTVTARDDIRLCVQCSKKVYLCASQEEVDSAAEMGKCVAFDSVQGAVHTGNSMNEGESFVLTKRTLGLPSSYMSEEGKKKLKEFFDKDPSSLNTSEVKNDSK